jgi:RimJ/RimL family protein N-acetyltransferase
LTIFKNSASRVENNYHFSKEYKMKQFSKKLFIALNFFGGIFFNKIQTMISKQDLESRDFKSSIFSYHDLNNPININAYLQSTNWYAKTTTSNDKNLIQNNIWNNPEIMKYFRDGRVRTPDETSPQFNMWLDRSKKGQPHGGLTIYNKNIDNKDIEEKIAYIIAGGGDNPGASEIAGAGLSEYTKRGIGSDVLHKIVTEWAPEVRRIGLAKNLDSTKYEKIIKNFQCFGGQVLERIDSTTSFDNPLSMKILLKNGFKPAQNQVDKESLINFEQKKIDNSSKEFIEELKKLYNPAFGVPLIPGKRYPLLNHHGNIQIFSYKEDWNCFKCHYEYKVA